RGCGRRTVGNGLEGSGQTNSCASQRIVSLRRLYTGAHRLSNFFERLSEVRERCKGAVEIFILRFFPCIPSGESAAHDDGLHLPPWFCDDGVSRYAHRVAGSPSPPP